MYSKNFILNQITRIIGKVSLGLIFGLVFQGISFGQVVNDECQNATIITLEPDEQFVCVEGTTLNASADIVPSSVCGLSSFPTVWYFIQTSTLTNGINIQLRGDPGSAPLVRLFTAQPDCNSLVPVFINDAQSYCLTGFKGHIEILSGQLPDIDNFYIAVTMLDPTYSHFELCANALYDASECLRKTELEIYRSPDKSPDDPYYAGEMIDLCFNILKWSPAGNGCQWLQGVVPVFGDAWSNNSFEANGQPKYAYINGLPFGQHGNGLYDATWDWFSDVDYHRFNYALQLGYWNQDDRKDLCSRTFDPECIDVGGMIEDCCGPCWDGAEKNILPPGWFCYSSGDDCPLIGPPISHDFGDGNSCTSEMGPWSFCFSLEIGNENTCLLDQSDDGTRLAMFIFSDWEVGSYGNNFGVNCFSDRGVAYHFPFICPKGPDSKKLIDINICNGDTLVFSPLDSVQGANVLYWLFANDVDIPHLGYLLPTDKIIKINSLDSNIVYSPPPVHFYGYSNAQDASVIMDVRFHYFPEITADFSLMVAENLVTFTGELSIPGDHKWIFGDGDSSKIDNPVHIYKKPGIYEVGHILITDCGNDTVFHSVLILPIAPIASFNIEKNELCVRDTLSAISFPGWNVEHYTWLFGGQEIANIDTNVLLWPMLLPGNFDLGLIVTNGAGADTLIYTDTIHVKDVPIAHFTFGIFDLLTEFHYDGTPADSLIWIFEGDSVLNGTDVAMQFEEPGDYSIYLLAYNDCGTDTFDFILHLEPVGITELNELNSFKVFPNPASDIIHLEYPSGSYPLFLEIYGSDGQRIKRFQSLDETLPSVISLSDLVAIPGSLFYFVLKDHQDSVVRSLIFQPIVH